MDTRDGRIYTPEEMEKLKKCWAEADARMQSEMADQLKAMRSKPSMEAEEKYIKMMNLAPTERQLARKPPRVGRNEPCPCGSGRKFKNCCLNSIK